MSDDQSNNLWLFLELLAKRKKFILSFVTLLTLTAIVVSLILPKWYLSSALVLPPKEQQTSVINLSDGASGLDLVSLSTTADVFVRILESRRITDPIIKRYKLRERYETETNTQAYEALMFHASIVKTEEGLLSIEVEDRDPKVAADLANAFVDGLDSLSRQVVAVKAREKRIFFEARLKKVDEDLSKSRKVLEEFQLKNKTIDFDEQTRMAIEQAIEIKVALSKTEVDLLLAKTTNVSQVDVKLLKQQKSILKKQLSELETGQDGNSFFALPLNKIPSLKNEYNKLYSKVRVGEELSGLLMQQFEQAKIQESGSFQEFSVLQRAQVPELKYRPKRTLIVVITFALSLLISILMAAIIEYFDKLKFKSEEDYNRAMLFFRSYFGWLPGIKKKSN